MWIPPSTDSAAKHRSRSTPRARALEAELDFGLLLPCNVVVYARGPHASTVAAMAPLAAMSLVTNAEVAAVAVEADQRLRAALTALERG